MLLSLSLSLSLSLLLLFLVLLLINDVNGFFLNHHPIRTKRMYLELNQDSGFGKSSIPKPNVIVPSQGSTDKSIEKFLMMYTCKICNGRNAHMVSKIAYTKGMVVATCRHCKSKHLIADNEGKLDMKEYGSKIEDYLTAKGEKVQKLSITTDMLEDYSLIDVDGELKIVPKMIQVDPSANIIDINNDNNKL